MCGFIEEKCVFGLRQKFDLLTDALFSSIFFHIFA
tara:strand:+ start:425 stop:529 length:105 start_codon:yes stop_codon:yes gene_type:complete